MAGGGWGMVGMGGIPTTGAEFSESLSLSPTLSSSESLLAASSVETSSEGGGGNVVGADGAVGEVEFPVIWRKIRL